MNSLLRIQVRVAAKEARTALRSIRTEIRGIAHEAQKINASAASFNTMARGTRGLTTGLRGTNAQIGTMNRQLATTNKLATQHRGIVGGLNTAINGASQAMSKGMIGMSKNLQWVGRQLNFNFTLPLAAAATYATGWALDVERAFTRVRKVYGDGSQDYTVALDKVAQGIRLLSDYFGVAQEQVMALAADYAAAGAEGGALLKSVETGLQLQILGDYDDLADTFAGLITIQKAFQLTTQETAGVIALLNTVENATEASLQGLVEGIEKAGASAAGMGVDFRELAAAIAAMTPQAGSPEEIGTSLKTLISRIAQPTSLIAKSFREVGVDIEKMKSQGVDAMGIIQAMADKTANLSDAERSRLASILGGRRQYNRVLALWDDMTNAAGRYQEVMRLLDPANDAKNMALAAGEIQTLLESDPRKLEIITTQIKNLAIDAISPLIPTLIGLVAVLREVMVWFNNLDPAMQKYIALGLAATVVTGILAQLIGSIGLLIGTLANFLLKPILLVSFFGKEVIGVFTVVGKAFGGLILGPWGIALAAAVGMLIIFHDEVGTILSDLWNFIISGFNKLPEGIANAMRAVVDVLAQTIEAISNFFQKLFGIEADANIDTNISASSRTIPRFHSGGVVPGSGESPAMLMGGEMVLTAKQQAELFKLATAGIRAANTANIRGGQIESVAEQSPASAAILVSLFAQLDNLEGVLNGVGSELEMQEAVVDSLDTAYAQASRAVKLFEKGLEPLEEEIDSLNQTISDAEARIKDLASVPLSGMGAMEDAIFENALATKRLRLEMLQLGDAADSYDEIKDRIASLNADIEMMQAKITTLRMAGAGSDILDTYKDQLDALEGQRDALRDQGKEAQKIEDQLSDLERAGEILQLTQEVTFDPLVREIDQMVNGVGEMDFDDVVRQIREQQRIIEDTNQTLDLRTQYYDDQIATLNILKAREQEIGEARDVEREKLEAIKGEYDKIKSTIGDIESLIGDTVSAAGQLAGVLEGGDFDDPILPKVEFDVLDLDAQLAELQRKIQESWDGFDVFGPLKEQWAEVEKWWAGLELDPGVLRAIGAAVAVLAATAIGSPWAGAIAGMIAVWLLWGDEVMGVVDRVANSRAWDDVSSVLGNIGTWVQRFFIPIWDQLKGAGDEFIESWDSIKRNVGPIMEALATVIGVLLVVLNPFLQVISGVFGSFVGFVASNALDTLNNMFQIVFETLGLIANIINGDFGAAWDNLKRIIQGFADLILDPFENLPGLLEGIGGTLVDTVVDIAGDVIGGFVGALESTFWGVLNWFGNMPWSIMNKLKEVFGISSPSTKMAEIGADVMAGLLMGLVDALAGLLLWVAELPLKIIGAMGDVLTKLTGKGKDLIGGLLGGIISKFDDVKTWIASIPDKALAAIGFLSSVLKDKGGFLLGGLWNGMKEKFDEAKDWVTSLPGKILDAFGYVSDVLKDKGMFLINGFTNGMKAAWDAFANWWNRTLGNKGFDIPGWVPGVGGKGITIPNMPTFGGGGSEGTTVKSTGASSSSSGGGYPGAYSIGSGGGDGRVINIYGDLSFPNVNSADDVEKFLDNLEAMAS